MVKPIPPRHNSDHYKEPFRKCKLIFKSAGKDTIHLGQLRIGSHELKLTRRKETISLAKKSITQDMAYRQSLMKYAEKYGVNRQSEVQEPVVHLLLEAALGRKCGVPGLPVSRRPHSHPNQHGGRTEAHPRHAPQNPTLGMIELWHRLRQRGYTRCPKSVPSYAQNGSVSRKAQKRHTSPKPYEQMTYPGERVQVDVKVVPRKYRRSEPSAVPVHRH